MAYVPWDISFLDKAVAWIRQAIGSSVNVGILIMAVLTAVAVVVMIIRHFTRAG